MESLKPLRVLAAATPLALAAVLAAAPQACAGVSAAALENPHVLAHGDTLRVMFDSAVSDRAADEAAARNVADTFVGGWAGGLIDDALRNTPSHAASGATTTCRMTTTAADPDGARGTASAAVPTGISTMQIDIPDQAPGTKWGVGDLDHFSILVTCTDSLHGAHLNRATIEQDETASAS